MSISFLFKTYSPRNQEICYYFSGHFYQILLNNKLYIIIFFFLFILFPLHFSTFSLQPFNSSTVLVDLTSITLHLPLFSQRSQSKIYRYLFFQAQISILFPFLNLTFTHKEKNKTKLFEKQHN